MTTCIYLQCHLALTYVGDSCPAISTGTTPPYLVVSYAKCERDFGLAVLMPCYRVAAPRAFKLSEDLVTQATDRKTCWWL